MAYNLLNDFEPLKKGFSVFSKKDAEGILVSSLFKAGKHGDEKAAHELIEQIWTDEKTQQLQKELNGQDLLFISVPSTSRTNMIPIAFAEFLASKLHCNYLVGDEHIYSLQSKMMKSIKNGQRVFYPRMYEAEEHFFDAVKKLKPNCQVVVVEDILTTGSSANTFVRFLKKNGLNVQRIFAIKGDTQLSPNVESILKLQKMADKSGLNIDMIALGKELTKSEVTSLAFSHIGEFYQAASAQEKELIKKQIQCLYEIKVNNNYEKVVELTELNEILEHKKGEQENENNKKANEKNKEKAKTSDKNKGNAPSLRERLAENSKRGEHSGESTSSSRDERIDDTSSQNRRTEKETERKPSETTVASATSDKQKLWKIGKTALLSFLGKNSNE